MMFCLKRVIIDGCHYKQLGKSLNPVKFAQPRPLEASILSSNQDHMYLFQVLIWFKLLLSLQVYVHVYSTLSDYHITNMDH